jgi:hypothetical protein
VLKKLYTSIDEIAIGKSYLEITALKVKPFGKILK